MLDDSCGLEELERAVDGSFGYRVTLGFECIEELVGFEEAFKCNDGIEDLGSFGGVFEIVGFEGSSEDGAEGFDEFWLINWIDGFEGHGGLYP